MIAVQVIKRIQQFPMLTTLFQTSELRTDLEDQLNKSENENTSHSPVMHDIQADLSSLQVHVADESNEVNTCQDTDYFINTTVDDANSLHSKSRTSYNAKNSHAISEIGWIISDEDDKHCYL